LRAASRPRQPVGRPDNAFFELAITCDIEAVDWAIVRRIRAQRSRGRGIEAARVRALEHSDRERLLIKEATARSHVHRIVTKLGLRTRAEAIILGFRLSEMPC
jgi:hypothetical protein